MEYRQIGSKAPLLFVPAPPLSSRRLWPYVLRDPTQLPLLPLLAGGCSLASEVFNRRSTSAFLVRPYRPSALRACRGLRPPRAATAGGARHTSDDYTAVTAKSQNNQEFSACPRI